jgi:hypothetical protein
MNSPQVVALIYHIEHNESVSYEDAKSFVRNEPEFRVKIKDKEVCFELNKHYATESEARESVKEYIHVWELDAGLRHGPDYFKLKFDRAKIVDRNPTPGVIEVSATFIGGAATGSFNLIVAPANYPSPPSGLSIDPDVQTMYDRYMNHRRGYEPLPSMAYFCLTILEYIAKTRKATAQHFNISKGVLDKIGELSSKKGGPSEARKAGAYDDLTEQERRFLKEAVKKMIYRAAEKINDPAKNLSQISLSDLPPV